MRTQFRLVIFVLCFLFEISNITLINSQVMQSNRSKLMNFSYFKNIEWTHNKIKADSLANALNIIISSVNENGKVIELQKFEKGHIIYYQTDNLNASKTISVDEVINDQFVDDSLSGEGFHVVVFDGGEILSNHQEFVFQNQSRIFMRDHPTRMSLHSTHIAGTMISQGKIDSAMGMASKATIAAYDFNNDLSEMASEASDGALVSNHSYGTICGWRYDSENDDWFWHGNYSISGNEDSNFGKYNSLSHDVDQIAYLAPQYLILKSAGNDRNDSPEIQPISHFIWQDNWILSDDYHQPDGGINGYDCLSPMGVAKNVLTVGSVADLPDEYLSSENVVISNFSSWGPTDDGRIKPDVVSNGEFLFSSSSENIDSYYVLTGTSMATASLSGAVLLLHQAQNIVQPGVTLNSSAIKASLIHTTDECGNDDGPDYQYGWGLVNIASAIELIKSNGENGGKSIIQETLIEGNSETINLQISENTSILKATLCWTDPPANSSPDSLNWSTSRLVNNLDMVITNTFNGNHHYPWVLNPELPSNAATNGVNSIDNVEQIQVMNPLQGDYTLTITHSGILSDKQQRYSLIITGFYSDTNLLPPTNLTYRINDRMIKLLFNSPSGVDPLGYHVYRDNELIAFIDDTLYSDLNVENTKEYNYYVKAVYTDNKESIATNQVDAIPQKSQSIPYYEDFENGLNNWTIKSSISGWRYGDSDSLNSYYLRFEADSTQFLAVDSYTAGEGVHTSDYAISPPINLYGCENITFSLQYKLVTELYDAIDQLALVYRVKGDNTWNLISQMPKAINWTNIDIVVPEIVAQNNVEFGLYYDDLYEFGMGAGIDNISVIADCSLPEYDITPDKLITPITSCNLNAENITIHLKNSGQYDIPFRSIILLTLIANDEILASESYSLENKLEIDSAVLYKFQHQIHFDSISAYEIKVITNIANDINPLNDTLKTTINEWGFPHPTILNLESSYCANDSPVFLEALPEGGTFEGVGMVGSFLMPLLFTPGANQVTYSVTSDNNCTDDTTYSFVINEMPEVFINQQDTSICQNSDSLKISAFPLGGSYLGEGVENDVFYPYQLSEDNYEIIYEYINSNGCQNSDSIIISVLPSTNVNITNLKNFYCQLPDTILIEANPIGGNLTPESFMEGYIFPHMLPLGVNYIKYSLINENGCFSEIIDSIEIVPVPFIELGNDTAIFTSDSLVISPQTDADNLFWFDDDSSTSRIFNSANLSFGENEIYITGINKWDCSCSDTILLTLEEDISISVHSTSSNIELFPNPTSSNFTISNLPKVKAKSYIEIFNTNGQIVLKRYVESFQQISISSLPKGFYLIKIDALNRTVFRKLVIE